MTETLRVQRLSPTAILPRRAKPGDAGFDLFADLGGEGRWFVLLPGQRTAIPTGNAMATPDGTYGRIAEKSGLARRYGVRVGGGVCDATFRGPYEVIVTVGTEEFVHIEEGVLGHRVPAAPLTIEHGMKVAQLVLERISDAAASEVEALDRTDRGSAGFGSTGSR